MTDVQSEEAIARLPVIQYWNEEKVPADIAEFLATFDEHSGGRPHLLFNESAASKFIAAHFGQREGDAFGVCGVPAMQADYFRYCALYVHGGLWFDADCRCLGDPGPLLRVGRATLFEGPDGSLKNWVLAVGAKRHPLLRMIVAFATANIESGLFDKVWIVTGPAILRALVDIWQTGSSGRLFDEVTAAADAKSPERVRLLEGYRETLHAVVGDGTPVAEAFRAADVEPVAEADELVKHGSSHLSYKRTEAHYPNFKSSIYR